MTEIKTAHAWWDTINGIVVLRTSEAFALEALPHVVTVVYGLTEAEVHEAAALRSACRELGIETVEQLESRLAPDPRVAVLEIALTKVAESDLSQVPYSQIKAHIEEALFRSQFIAAQRGEGV